MREPIWDAVITDPMVAQLDEIRARGGSYRELIETRTRIREQTTTLRLYSGAYAAKDGIIMLGALTPASRTAARRTLGITNDPTEFPIDDSTAPEVVAQMTAVKRQIEQVLLERTVAEWIDAFDAGGVPAAPVNFPELMADDPVVQAEGIMHDVVHEITGPQRVVGPLFEMSATPTAVQGASPPLGRHTSAVLAEAGFTPEEIEDLHESGVVRSFS